MGKDRYGCSTRKNRGTCENAVTVTRQVVEERVLAGIKRGLLAPKMVERFVARVTQQLAARRTNARSDEVGMRKRLAEVKARIGRLLDQMEDGDGDAAALRDRLKQREAERYELEARLAELAKEQPKVVALPNFAHAYADHVRRLEEVLRDPMLVQRAHETLARMIEKIVLTPDASAENGLRIEIHGQVAEILRVCHSIGENELPSDSLDDGSQLSVVAGVGFEPTTFRL